MFRILRTKAHAMSSQYASFFKEKCKKKTTSMPDQLVSKFYKPNPKAFQVSYLAHFKNHPVPFQLSIPALPNKNKKINFSIPGKLFSQIYRQSPRVCQVS